MKINKLFILPLLIVSSIFVSCPSNIVSDGLTEYHHIFPRQFREQFAQKGINVDNFTIALTKKDHRGLGVGLQYVPKNWNNEWNEWLLQHPNFTQEQAAEKALQMLKEAGCKGEFNFYDYNTKQLSNASVGGMTGLFVCSSNWFLKICSKIGYWLLKVLGGSSLGGQLLAILAALGSSVLGLFGLKAEQPVAVGIGLLCMIFGILACVGLVLFVKWLLTIVLIGGAGVGAIANND